MKQLTKCLWSVVLILVIMFYIMIMLHAFSKAYVEILFSFSIVNMVIAMVVYTMSLFGLYLTTSIVYAVWNHLWKKL